MNPGQARPHTQLSTTAGIALLVTLGLVVAGILASIWTGQWLYAITGVLVAVIPFAVAAWHMGTKVESK